MADKTDEDDPTTVVTEDADQPGAGGTQPLEVEEGIEDLRAKLAAATARAERAERTATAAVSQVDQAQDEITRSNLTVISGAIDQLTQNKESLKAQYADAMASGDFAKAADVQSSMAENAVKLLNLENGKIAIETAPKREARRTATASGDPVERAISDWKLSSASAEWVRKHPEYATDPRKTQRMLAAHNLAVTDDLEPETPEYFAHVERTLGMGHSDARPPQREAKIEAPLSAAAAPAQRRDSQPPPAPASRGGSNGRTIRLTPQQAEAAKISGLTNEEYAKQLDRVAKDRPN